MQKCNTVRSFGGIFMAMTSNGYIWLICYISHYTLNNPVKQKLMDLEGSLWFTRRRGAPWD